MTGRLYDVAIVGAGPAGSSTATYLARAGWRVALVDRAAFPRDKPCAEYLSPAAEPLLRDLGVMDALAVHPPSRLLGFRIYARCWRRLPVRAPRCASAGAWRRWRSRRIVTICNQRDRRASRSERGC